LVRNVGKKLPLYTAQIAESVRTSCTPRRKPEVGETLNSHPSSADLKNVWRYTSTPPAFLRGVHMDYEGGDTTEQVIGQLNLPGVGLRHCYHDKSRASRLRAGQQSGVAVECVDREVAAGRNLNDRSFTLHSNLIYNDVMGAACSAHVKDKVPVHAMKTYRES
jgi:hypothetical protein